jgi:hypothetical protein
MKNNKRKKKLSIRARKLNYKLGKHGFYKDKYNQRKPKNLISIDEFVNKYL